VDPAAPARHAALRHARRKGTTRSNQKQELSTTGQTPKAHGIGSGTRRRRGASASAQAAGGTGPGTRRTAPARAGAVLYGQCAKGVAALR
jgi:hypothetical protein